MEILVFKTNLSNAVHINNIMPALNFHPHIVEWNVDLHDCDNVLRIVSKNMQPGEVEQMLSDAGYYCEELE
ncbi:MAG TPA: hypothetical protein PLZ45_01070 [Ferruginibacter sp.]|nr:hypothetical protein [Ferruginibacter sp.]